MTAHAKTAEPSIVNGINLDDLFALIGGIKRDASKAKTSWRVATTWQGQARSRAEVTGFRIGDSGVSRRFTFDTDEPCELAGSNRFANAPQHLTPALSPRRTVGSVAQYAVR